MINTLLIILSLILLSGCSPKIQTKIEETSKVIENITETVAPQPSIIQESGLPNKHQINTAFIPQAPEKNWDQPWQDSCEEASILTVHYYYLNQNPDLPTLLSEYQKLFSQSSVHDINLNQMAAISSKLYGYQPLLIDNPDVEVIKKYISLNTPVIITANGKTLFKENKRFKSGGPWYHSLVILGYDDTISKFTVHDVGTQFGAYFKYSYSLLMDSIHDLPSSGIKEDIDTGDKKVLVLLK